MVERFSCFAFSIYQKEYLTKAESMHLTTQASENI